MKQFGEALREAREKAKLTREQVAAETGLAYITIARVERGMGMIRLTRLALLAKFPELAKYGMSRDSKGGRWK